VEFDMREDDTWDESRQEVTRTVCFYCGVGCNLDLHTQEGNIVSVTSPHDHDVTLGNLCIKGRFGWSFVSSGKDD
jgi:predicted molibdopterin-dependent oxidoreductase YjgC